VPMAERAAILALFRQHDTDKSNTIDEAELLAVMSGIGFGDEECKKMFTEADVNADGVINYEEFLAWVFNDDVEEEAPEVENDEPFLKQAFELMTKVITDLSTAAMEGGDIEAGMENERAMQRQFVELLGKSFDHYDKSHTGALDTGEAKVFFGNLVAEHGAFMDAAVTISIKKLMNKKVQQMMEATRSEGREGTEGANLEAGMKMALLGGMREALRAGIEDTKTQFEKQLEEYKANKEERDAAAFAIIDADKTGTIEKKEFIAAFTLGSRKNDKVMEALGLETPDRAPSAA